VSLAGVIIAVGFSLAHATAFWHVPFPSALGQQVYAIALGILYAYLFEQSGSVLAPAIAHNAGDFIEWSLCFALRAIWPR
jgi:membrane protease YdiL (CAAX protease family)